MKLKVNKGNSLNLYHIFFTNKHSEEDINTASHVQVDLDCVG